MKYVLSTYRSRWRGIVLDVIEKHYILSGKKHTSEIAKVLLAYDRSGNPFRKKVVKEYGVGWLKEVEPFDISHLREDWFE